MSETTKKKITLTQATLLQLLLTHLSTLSALWESLTTPLQLPWTEFQHDAIQHLGKGKGLLMQTLCEAHEFGKLQWQASISGHTKYSDKMKFVIHGQLDFLEFGAQAQESIPDKVIIIKLIMKEPVIAASPEHPAAKVS